MTEIGGQSVRGRSSAHLLLLSKYKDPREKSPGDYISGHSQEDWEAALNEPVSIAISHFIDQDLLMEGSLPEKLAFILKVPELRDRLRERSLSSSGKKIDLAKRIAESDPAYASLITESISVVKCTGQGIHLIDEYLEAIDNKRAAMERSLIDLITCKRFGEAVITMASFEASQVFPRGMGIDWSDYDPEPDVKILQLIFSQVPKSISDIPSQYLHPFRVGASMLNLIWNVGQVSTWLSENISMDFDQNLFKISSDLHSHALYLEEIESLKAMGVLRVEVRTCNDSHVCESCRSISSKVHRITNAPEIPNPDCSSSWCRCFIVGLWS